MELRLLNYEEHINYTFSTIVGAYFLCNFYKSACCNGG